MTDEEILECSISILNFLNDDSVLTYMNMNECLEKYKEKFILMTSGDNKYELGISMVSFCSYLNDKYQYYDVLYKKTLKEFFMDDYIQPGHSKAKIMLKHIIRDFKLNELV